MQAGWLGERLGGLAVVASALQAEQGYYSHRLFFVNWGLIRLIVRRFGDMD